MIIPTSPDAMQRLLREMHDEIEALKRGAGTKGEASFANRIRIGDWIIEDVDAGGGTRQLLARRATGGPTVILATL